MHGPVSGGGETAALCFPEKRQRQRAGSGGRRRLAEGQRLLGSQGSDAQPSRHAGPLLGRADADAGGRRVARNRARRRPSALRRLRRSLHAHLHLFAQLGTWFSAISLLLLVQLHLFAELCTWFSSISLLSYVPGSTLSLLNYVPGSALSLLNYVPGSALSAELCTWFSSISLLNYVHGSAPSLC